MGLCVNPVGVAEVADSGRQAATGGVGDLGVADGEIFNGTEYKIEILAYAVNGNRTIAQSTFVTEEED